MQKAGTARSSRLQITVSRATATHVSRPPNPEQPITVLLDVIALQQPLAPLPHNSANPEFALDEW
jgi:hypothetical protein